MSKEDDDAIEGQVEPKSGGFAPVKYMPTSITAPAKLARPGRNQIRAGQDDLDFYNATQKDREDFIANDPVMKSAKNHDSLQLLGALKQEVARETASLAYQRVLAERMGKESSNISTRRVDALKKIADIELEMRKIGFDQIDVRGEKFQKIVALWIAIIKKVAEETLTPELLDLFFNRLTTEMEGWEEEAESVIR